jgi:dCMP deaminase
VNKTYFNNNKVEFENVFLRWNRPVSTQELEVAADRKISNDTFHKEMMARAEVLAEKSANWWRQIGVLAVRDGEIIAEAFNAHVPTQQNMAVYGDLRMCFDAGECHELSNSIHGEAALIARCAREGIQLKGADLFVTVYPCPTCAKLIAEAGINTVYYRQGYSLSDAEDILKAEGVEIILVKFFFKNFNSLNSE